MPADRRSRIPFTLRPISSTRKSKLDRRRTLARGDVLLARSKAMRERPGNGRRAAADFAELAKFNPEVRARSLNICGPGETTASVGDMAEGSSTAGKTLVPETMYGMMAINAIAQSDPLFDEDVVRLVTDANQSPLIRAAETDRWMWTPASSSGGRPG